MARFSCLILWFFLRAGVVSPSRFSDVFWLISLLYAVANALYCLNIYIY